MFLFVIVGGEFAVSPDHGNTFISEDAIKKPASILCDSFCFIAYGAAITIEMTLIKLFAVHIL